MILHLILALAMVAGLLSLPAPQPAWAASSCQDGYQANGAIYRICMPPAGQWNGDLVVFAHGYVAFNQPIGIPESQLVLPDGTTLPELVNGLGYAFAMSSYRVNGLAIQEGIVDTLDVVQIFRQQQGDPRYIYLTGASEGGIITSLSLERHPSAYHGGLSTCGPVGNFQRQVNYWGDVRVLLDYFFPGLLPGSAIQAPDELIENWDSLYRDLTEQTLRDNPHLTRQLLVTGRVPHNPANLETGVQALMGVIWYNVFATNDGIAKLGGQPFDNTRRIYIGSDDDPALNALVQRYSADAAARNTIGALYQTSGAFAVPQVMLHTVGDPVIPHWHQPLYRQKAIAAGSGPLQTVIPSPALGHCQFQAEEVLAAFALLVFQVSGQLPQGVEAVLPDGQSVNNYHQLLQSFDLDR